MVTPGVALCFGIARMTNYADNAIRRWMPTVIHIIASRQG
jgi:hypothetical protein